MGRTIEEMNAATAIVDGNGNLVAITPNVSTAETLIELFHRRHGYSIRPADEDDIAEIGRRVVDDI